VRGRCAFSDFSLFSILLHVANALLFASLCISHARRRGGATVRCEEEQWQWQWSSSPATRKTMNLCRPPPHPPLRPQWPRLLRQPRPPFQRRHCPPTSPCVTEIAAKVPSASRLIHIARFHGKNHRLYSSSPSRNCEFYAKTSGITETERTPIRDHRDTTNEEPQTPFFIAKRPPITPLRSSRGTQPGACARAPICPTFTPYYP